MIRVHHSNRLERLLVGLEAQLSAAATDPLTPQVIVVQHPGMGRWLAEQLALHGGIATNLAFPLPAAWIWQAMRLWLPDLPESQTLSRETLGWHTLAILPAQLADPAFREVSHYLRGDEDGLRCYQLCQRIAALFDQYLVYRPDWVLGWEAGEDEHWQARLWRAIRARCPTPHWARVLQRFFAAAASGAPPQQHPEPVCLFGLTALSPAYVAVLQALSAHCTLELFLLNPCREYWADVLDEKGQAKRRARAAARSLPDPGSSLVDQGNPLLASLGRAGQALLDQLLEAGSDDQEAFVDPGDRTLLHRLQQDILSLRDGRSADPRQRTRLAPDDRSLQIHSCHSPMREVQVLQDQLLHLFQTLPGLQPRDILVMAPDIDRYAPLIAAVFGATDSSQAIPWSIADRRPRRELPVLGAFATLLDLPASRLEASAVLDLLEVPALGRRFALEAAGIERIRTWVRESGIRWGGDAAMRAELGLPPEATNTWAFGFERLFLGYALPTGSAPYQGVAPYADLEGSSAADLGALQELLERLNQWRHRLPGVRSASRWCQLLSQLMEDFFEPDDEEAEALQGVRATLETLERDTALAAFSGDISLAILRERLLAELDAPRGTQHFLTGRVSCCSLVPLRSIPFRVIYLLGMSTEDFPRQHRPLDFDLIARFPRRGDRSPRDDDRYLFLETLLSARDRLHLSYVGRSLRDNSLKVPCAPLGELLDYLEQSFAPPDGGDLVPWLTLEHPLQPFSHRYFDGRDPHLLSYAQGWLAAPPPGGMPGAAPDHLAPNPLPEASDLDTLELDALIGFLCNPAAHFLRHRLGARLPEERSVLEDREPFAPDGLERYGLRQRLVALAGTPLDWPEVLARLRAEGVLPHGAFAALWVEAQRQRAEPFLARWQTLLGRPREPLGVKLSIGGITLTGQLRELGDAGLVRARFAALKGKDRLRLWVHHLALSCLRPPVLPRESIHLAEGAALRLRALPGVEAAPLLADLLALYRTGLTYPLPFFPECAWHWITQGYQGSFWSTWRGNPFNDQPGEQADPWIHLAFRDSDPFGAPFETLAVRIYGPLRAAVVDAETD